MGVVTDKSLDLAELARLVQEADPAALLVPKRLLRRVIKYDRELSGFGLQVPHRKTYVIARGRLLQAVEEDQLGEPLPSADTLLLIALPDADKLLRMSRSEALIKYWRLLFHARIHQAIERRFAEQHFTAAAIRERVHRIGQVEFEEIRRVLWQEKMLLPPRDDRTVYEEFAASYLEMRHFAPALLLRYFSTMERFDEVDAILAHDVDAATIFETTRLPGAPDPVSQPPTPPPTERPIEPLHAAPAVNEHLADAADLAARAGNHAGAAVRRLRAGQGMAAARAELSELAQRLAKALSSREGEIHAWLRVLPALLPRAAEELWPSEARLLYDLQEVCLAHERTVYEPNFLRWFGSLFRKPLLEPLPHQQAVQAVKSLRRALKRLPATHLQEADRHALSGLLHEALHRSEHRLRERFRPLIEEAISHPGLEPQNVPERVALGKVREVLLDRVVEHGLLTLQEVRDALSGNQLKLPDLTSARELVSGDPVLQTNRRLAANLRGVYRFGEFYLRALQRLSSLAFGTPVGRFLVLYIVLPLAGSFVLLKGTEYLIHEVLHLAGKLTGHAETALAEEATKPHKEFVTAPLTLGFALFLLLTMHVGVFRELVVETGRTVWQLLRALVIELPAQLIGLPVVRQLLASRPYRLLANFVIKPALVTLPVRLALDQLEMDDSGRLPLTGLFFVSACLALNSRLGREAQDRAADWLRRTFERTRYAFVGLLRLLQEDFKLLLEGVDRVLYSVDEWLRFRSGEGKATFAAKILLAPLWRTIAYLVRFLLRLFIEPQINPIKHFPVVTVAHKLLLPLTPTLAGVLMEHFGYEKAAAGLIALLVIGKIPGVFGFMVWELKENWKLYKANRPATLQAILIGSHGETMLRFMRLGFHSGTLPRLHARLRRAERRAGRTRDRRAAQKYREGLHHAAEEIQRFVERELVNLLKLCGRWGLTSLRVSRVEAGSNRIRIELECLELDHATVEIAFEEQAGWLLAGIARVGWLPGLTPQQRDTFARALAGLYKLAGVDLVREQIDASFPRSMSYDVAEEGLVVWPGDSYDIEAVYDLRAEPVMKAIVRAGPESDDLPDLITSRVRFRDLVLPWDDWVLAWQNSDHVLLPRWLELLSLESRSEQGAKGP